MYGGRIKSLEDFVMVVPNVVSTDLCLETVKELQDSSWLKHDFVQYNNDVDKSYQKSPCETIITHGTDNDDIPQSELIMKEWSKRIESLHYYYEQDIDYILDRMTANDIEFDDIFTSHDGQHPPILKMVLSKKICVETFVILEDILSFANRLDKDILETVLWPKMHDRMARYKPFLKYDTPRFKITLRKKVKEL